MPAEAVPALERDAVDPAGLLAHGIVKARREEAARGNQRPLAVAQAKEASATNRSAITAPQIAANTSASSPTASRNPVEMPASHGPQRVSRLIAPASISIASAICTL